jgi:hypothetical protein
VPIPKLTPYIYIPFFISTIALNPPLLKLYDYTNFALNNINKFTKGQSYIILQIVKIVEVKIGLDFFSLG